jgi:CCR4-NOT transcriptional regulation complex NOT5 subunit
MSFTQDLMKIQWNAAALADHYIITLSSVNNDNESASTVVTSNTTIHLPLQYNQDYNVSVMASNCAGNSTPVEISVRVGKL